MSSRPATDTKTQEDKICDEQKIHEAGPVSRTSDVVVTSDNPDEVSEEMSSLVHSTRVGTVLQNVHDDNEPSVQGKDMRWMCHPHRRGYYFWKWVVVTVMLYDMVSAPLQVGWEMCKEDKFCVWFTLDVIADTIFILDILVRFRTALVEKRRGQENIVWDIGAISMNYLATDFWIDAGGVGIPYFGPLVALYQMVSQDTTPPHRAFKLVSLFRVLRLFKVNRMITELTKVPVAKKKYLNLGKLLFVLLYSGHLVGCLLWFVASDSHTHPLRTSWAYAAGLNQADFYVQYISSVYFAMATVTTVGYGDISAKGGIEQLFVCFLMLLFGLYYVYIVGTFTHIVDNLSKTQRGLILRVSQVHSFCTSFRIDDLVQHNVIETLKYKWSFAQSLADLDDTLSCLPKTLKLKVLATVYMPTLYKTGLFSGCDETVIRTLSSLFREEVYLPDTDVLSPGEISNSLYVTDAGVLEVINPMGTPGRTLKNGHTFGELHAFVPNVTVINTVRTQTKCELLAITGTAMMGVLNHFPETRREMETQILDEVKKTLRLYVDYQDTNIFHAGQFTCIIHSATDLPNRDHTSTSDPYVEVELLGRKKPLIEWTQRTNVLLDTVNPVWSEDFNLSIEKLRDLYFDMLDKTDEHSEAEVGSKIDHKATSETNSKSQSDTDTNKLAEEDPKIQSKRRRLTLLDNLSPTEEQRRLRAEQALRRSKLPVKDVSLKLRVMDRDIVTHDDLLGSCEIQLDDLLNNNLPTCSLEQWHRLTGPDNKLSEAKLKVELLVRHTKFAISQQVSQLRMVKNELENKLRFFDIEAKNNIPNTDNQVLWLKMNQEIERLQLHVQDLQKRCL